MIMVERPGCCPALIGAIVQCKYCVAKLPNPDHWLCRNWKKKTWFLMNPFLHICRAAIITFGVLQHPILHSKDLKLCYKVCDQKQKLKLKVFLRLDRDVSGHNIPFIHNMPDFDFFGPSPQAVLLHFYVSLSRLPLATVKRVPCICVFAIRCICIFRVFASWVGAVRSYLLYLYIFCMFQLNCSNLCVFSFTSAGSAKPVCCVS